MTTSPAAIGPSSQANETGRADLTSWERLSFTIAHTATTCLLACLSLSGLHFFGRMFGTLEWLINYKRRRRFARALAHVLGREPTSVERRRATRKFFIRTRCDKLLYLIFDRIPRDKAESLLSISNRGMLDDMLARGHGVYLAFSHHGAHHVTAMLMALKGYKVAAVRERHESGIRRFVQNRFDRLYPEFGRLRVLFSDSYPRDLFRCFKEGYVLGSAMDVNRAPEPNQKTEEVTMFGEKRLFLSGPLRAALRCGAPVLQAFTLPEEGFRYRLDIVETLLEPANVDDEDQAVARAMRTYAANVEKYIRESPTLISRA